MTTEQEAMPLAWVRSSFSGSGGGNCVEVACTGAAVRVRDSKVAGGPQLAMGRAGWAAFVASVTR
ncbi:DUF397 domain-containing protein [Streptomyces sp. 8N114]|uniref:DUF397 domain-containing protein n=1 Tax=Streptomyces sp. 8N114 TaxID=3457419 RepID=UPI003FD5B053